MTNATQNERRDREPHPGGSGRSTWFSTRSDGLEILRARALEQYPWLVHGFSTRWGGVSRLPGAPDGQAVLNLGYTDRDTRANVDANRSAFLAGLGANDMKLVTLRQVHSCIVHRIESTPQQAPRGDALFTRSPNLLLGVQTADCIPMLLADPNRKVIAAVHAGWRGTLQRIGQKCLGQMHMVHQTSPADVIAVLGPGIGACCYEVGPEVAQAYASQFACAAEWFRGPFDQLAAADEPNPLPWLSSTPPGHDAPPLRACLDLVAANRWQLLDAGVLDSNIISSELCTACRTDLLFSHRREAGRTGRMMAVVGLRPES